MSDVSCSDERREIDSNGRLRCAPPALRVSAAVREGGRYVCGALCDAAAVALLVSYVRYGARTLRGGPIGAGAGALLVFYVGRGVAQKIQVEVIE